MGKISQPLHKSTAAVEIGDIGSYKKNPIQLGYERKGVLRTGTGNRICPNPILVLVTELEYVF